MVAANKKMKVDDESVPAEVYTPKCILITGGAGLIASHIVIQSASPGSYLTQ